MNRWNEIPDTLWEEMIYKIIESVINSATMSTINEEKANKLGWKNLDKVSVNWNIMGVRINKMRTR